MRMRQCVALLVAIAATVVHAQQPPPRAPAAVNAGVTAVLVDVVVRDRNGRPVRDLTQADFEVTEDGVPQAVGSFSTVFDGEMASPAGPASPAVAPSSAADAIGSPLPVSAGPAVTALVFDRLTPEGRRLAVQAAQNYLGKREEVPNYVGIFDIDLALTSYTPFTRSGYALRQALSRMATRASSSFTSPEQREQQASADQRAAGAGAVAASGAAAGGPGASAAVGTAPGDAGLARIEARMLEDFDLLGRDQQGYASTNGLFAIINSLARLPGRKSLVLFSEGIAITPPVQRLFLGVIDAANRANVSIYTMDAAGLRASSEQAKIRDEVNRAAGAGINTGHSPGGVDDGPLTKSLEKNEDVLRQDPNSGLGSLAQGTGGLLFDSTNSLREGFDRVESDLRNYYLVGYTPTNTVFDGRFRAIEVKVRRPGVVVAARKGYFAVRDTGGGPVNSWEAPALGALERKPVPNAFPVHVAALLFPERDRPGLVPVVVEFKTAPLTFQPSSDGKTYSSDFAVLVRFLDHQNRVVRKVSQHYEVSGPIAALERAGQGDVIFYREPVLPPGLYIMETVVRDAPSGKASVRFATVEVPQQSADELRASSLVLVKRAEKLPDGERRADNPLLFRDALLRPNLGEPVSRAEKELGFYFAVYPGSGRTRPESTIELLQNAKLISRMPLPLAGADAAGRIQQVGRLPLDQLTAGTYELRAVVTQGSRQVVRSAILRLAD